MRSTLRPPNRSTTLARRCILALLLAAALPVQADSPANPKNQAGSSVKADPKARTDYTGEYVNFSDWKEVQLFCDEMVRNHGFERSALDALFAQVRYVDTTLQLIKPAPPGKPKNWQAYRARFVEPVRIDAGVQFWNDNVAALARAESEYGVPAEVIIGIIGVETLYGRNTGRFRVLDALTTLAFDYPPTVTREARMAFFRSELESALLFARQDKIDPLSLLGSYAGAVGLPQFMPSSIIKYAVDFDGDGVIDLRNSSPDAIGSIANYLVQHGWQRFDAAPFVYPVSVSFDQAWQPLLNLGLQATLSEPQLQTAGISSSNPLPAGQKFGLVDLQNGAEASEYWLATNNFYAITQYNRSYFYAMSVLELGRAVRLARTMQ